MESDAQSILSKKRVVPDLKIRPSVPEDFSILGVLYAESYFEIVDILPPPRSETLEEFTTMMTDLFKKSSVEDHEDIVTWIAEYSGAAVGFLISKITQDSGYVGEIGVLPQHRRRGIAVSLLCELANYLDERCIRKIELDVDTRNTSAISFYKFCGFTKKREWVSQEKGV
jgi:ribosomal protein S18 acetylase RimI-like enzyme